MLPIIFKKSNLKRLGTLTSMGLLLTACSSLNQKPYDVDGIYNNSKIVVEDTHEKGAYYSEYFKEKEQEAQEYFTDVDNYTSNYEQGNPGWGDTTSSTQIVYDWGFGYGSPYMWGNSYWGFGYGWNSYWGSPFYGGGFGWGYPYYGYGWGWGYPYYGYGWGNPYISSRNISRSNNHRAMNSRSFAMASRTNSLQNGNRSLTRTNSFVNNRNLIKTDRTFARTNSSINRMQATERVNTTFNGNRSRFENTNTIQNTNRRSNSTPTMNRNTTRPTYTPSSTRMNSGGSFGGSRSGGSMGGGMRSGSGGRR